MIVYWRAGLTLVSNDDDMRRSKRRLYLRHKFTLKFRIKGESDGYPWSNGVELLVNVLFDKSSQLAG